MIWTMLQPGFTFEGLGYLPDILSDDDPRPAREQLDDRYRHGGGYRADYFSQFKMGENRTLKWPNEPSLYPLAAAKLHDETIVFYPYALLAVIQPDGDFEVTRVD